MKSLWFSFLRWMMLTQMLLALLLSCPQAEAENLREKVIKTGCLRAGYVVYPPLLMKDPNAKTFSGIGFETLALASKRLGLKLQITEEAGFATMIEGLRTGRYDIIVCPIWANASRARMADFSRPLFYSPLYAYSKKGDKRIDSTLKGVVEGKFKIATIDGEMAELITNTDFPRAKKFSLPHMASASELLLSISSGKADLTFTEPSLVHDFLKHNPNTLQNVTPNKPIRVFPNCFMFKPGEQEFKAMLNLTLDEIVNSGEMEKIILKYEPFPHAFLRCARPYSN